MKHLPGLLVVLPFLFFFALCQLQWKTQATSTEGDILQQTYWVNKQHGPPRNPSDVLVSVHQQRVSISWRNRGTLSPNNDLLIVKNKNFWHTLSCPLIMSSRERIFSPPSRKHARFLLAFHRRLERWLTFCVRSEPFERPPRLWVNGFSKSCFLFLISVASDAAFRLRQL